MWRRIVILMGLMIVSSTAVIEVIHVIDVIHKFTAGVEVVHWDNGIWIGTCRIHGRNIKHRRSCRRSCRRFGWDGCWYRGSLRNGRFVVIIVTIVSRQVVWIK